MGFKFSDSKRTVKIEIEDKIYSVTLSEGLIGRIKAFKRSKPPEKNEISAVRYMDGVIDGILGTGKAEEIFKGRPDDPFDRADVLSYIFEEISKAAKSISAAYGNKNV